MKPFLLAFLAAVQVSSAAAAPLFRNPQPVRLPSDATTFLLGGDFNSDGHLDALVVGGGQYSVLLANGTGPFAAPLTGSLFPTPCCGEPAVGDMNGDSKLDLVLVLMGAIHVLAGNGDGTFTAGSATATTSNVGSTTLADFNGDDLLDLAIGAHSIGDTTLTVHFGDGEGNFSGAETTDIGAQTYALTPAYINGDGVVDLVAGWPASRVLIGVGDGTFTLGASFPDGRALVADFNHDGDADLAVTTGTFDNDSIEVSLGNGDGTFDTPAQYATARQPGSGTVADVNDDGNPDILMTGTSGSVVAVHRGNADGTFDAVAYYLSGPNPNQILAADFDRNGDVDFVTADQDTNIPALSFVRGNGDATFDAYRAFHWPDLAADRMVVEDVNHDDAPDVLALQSDNLAVLLNDGTGKLEAPIVSETEVDSQYFATGDVNNDGHLDAVIVNEDHSAGAKTLLGNGDGTFDAPIANASLDGAGPATLAHFNGDAYLDVFMAGGAAYAEVYAGNGDGTFAGATSTSMDARDAIFGDLNGDDITDFVRWKTGAITIALNDGTGQFTSADIATGGAAILALADFNGDDALDLVSRTTSGTETRFGNGDGTFDAPVLFTIEPALNVFSPSATADFDGDGKLDLAANSTVYLGNGDGTFRSREHFRTSTVTGVRAADMDGNSTPDLLVAKFSAVDVLLTRTKPDATATLPVTLQSSNAAPQPTDPITFTASIGTGSFVATGTILFQVNGAPYALIAVEEDDPATFEKTFAAGDHVVTATYTGDDNYLETTATLNFTVYGTFTSIVPQLTASANGTTLSLSWSPITGAASYDIWVRKSLGGSWELFANYSSPAIGATAAMPTNTAWLFAVTANNGSGDTTAMSAPDLATSVAFVDPTLTAGVTPLKAQHVLDLRTAIAAVRTLASLSAFTFTTNVAAGQPVRATDFDELRTAATQARTALGLAAVSFTDPTLTPGVTPIRAQHIRDLRSSVD